MAGLDTDNTRLTIGGHYLIDLRTALPSLSGCPAYRAADMMTPGAALIGLAPPLPPARFQEFLAVRHPALMPVLMHDMQAGALWALCNGPPGPPIIGEGFSGWRENFIIEGVVRPLASLIETLQRAGLTARAIRPDNVFCIPGSHQVVLGPLGLTPPGLHQPVLFEPLSSAVCAPIGRGSGTIACDMFSLGVLVLSLIAGRLPLAGCSDDEILRRRFEKGSYLAYTEGLSVPGALSTLIAALLSDDPALRPSPRDIATVSQRTMFSTPPDTHARVPLKIGDAKVRTVRALAWHASREPAIFSTLMQRRVLDRWLQRELEMGALVHSIEHVVNDMSLSSAAGLSKSGDNTTPMLGRILNVLDPNAPLFLGGRWFWPEALPVMLAHAQLVHAQAGRTDPNVDEHQLTSLLAYIMTNGASFQRGMPPGIAQQIKILLQGARRSIARGRDRVLRLPFDENPYLPCLSPRCVQARISQPQALLAWLNTASPQTIDAEGGKGILDPAMRHFLDSHAQRRSVPVMAQGQRAALPQWLADLALLAAMQARFGNEALSQLAASVLGLAIERLSRWRSRSECRRRTQQLQAAAARGDLDRMFALIEDRASLRLDAQGAVQAGAAIADIEERLRVLTATAHDDDSRLRQHGNFVALIVGVAAACAGCWIEFVA